ncbi:LLM class flavin-dependent oxidoreductase [Microbacteriaceae bacterium VKM Ac-2854]|nr:LLM class flavin-dependent oxidoreductase [Microbacteriaceae bacterium VKM Ac-2854]
MAAWRDQVRRIADQGYATLLMPDVPGWQPPPGPTLAVAATLTGLHVGTWVYASPLRPAWIVAAEAHGLTELTEGRFELGIGTGRPGIEDLVRDLGQPPVDVIHRVERIREIVTRLRDLDGPDRHTPVVMAVRGPRACALAVELADVATLATIPTDERADIEKVARELRATRNLPLALHVSVVGNVVAPFMAGPDTDPAVLREADSLAYLPADPSAAVDELLRRREECGFSTVVIGANSADTFAPVIERLAGR